MDYNDSSPNELASHGIIPLGANSIGITIQFWFGLKRFRKDMYTSLLGLIYIYIYIGLILQMAHSNNVQPCRRALDQSSVTRLMYYQIIYYNLIIGAESGLPNQIA